MLRQRKVVWLPEPLGKHCDQCWDGVPVRRVWHREGQALIGNELCAQCASQVDGEVSIFVPVDRSAQS
jgi:hypothetical protein